MIIKDYVLKLEYVDVPVGRDNWYKWIYRIYYDANEARTGDQRYVAFFHGIDEYIALTQLSPEQCQQIQQKQKRQEPQQIRADCPVAKETNGKMPQSQLEAVLLFLKK
ncbi:hypothetical protein CHS0354_010182, partial [Potamilus streckersoni]